MIIKTHKDVYRDVAGSFNIDDDIVRAIGDFYWKEISSIVSNLEKREIYITKLGSIRLRKGKCETYINSIPIVENMVKNSGRPEETIQKSLETISFTKERLQTMIDEINFIFDERTKYKEKKYAYRDLQKQKADLGRIEE